MSGRSPRQGWALPGPLALRLAALLIGTALVAGAASGSIATRAAADEALQRVMRQQADEVQTLARVFASKIEQSQKVLRTVASGITPQMLSTPYSLEWLLRQGLPAVQFFDTMQVARADGTVSVNLQYGMQGEAAALEPSEREALRRTLIDGKPVVSELVGNRAGDARVMFTQPLHGADGSLSGVLAGSIRLQSQGLLPASIAPPEHAGSRLVVFSADGTILSHPDPRRVLGKVSEEPGLAQAYQALALHPEAAASARTEVVPGFVVSLATMPLPQWTVARVSEVQALLAPLEGTQRTAWWLAVLAVGLTAVLGALLSLWQMQPLARLRERALELSQQGDAEDSLAPAPGWGDEVGTLARLLDGFVQERSGQALRDGALTGSLQAILDHAPVGIVITRAGRLSMLGRQAAQMLGYTTEELIGRPVRALYGSDAAWSQGEARARAAFAAHGAFDGDLCFARKDGSPVWARVQGRAAEAPGMSAGIVWILEELTAVHEARRQRRHERLHDPITGLPDRRAFEERLRGVLLGRDEIVAAQGELLCGVVMYLDLDHFTVVNDIAGHSAGDDVLEHVARLLEAQVRQAGWVARLGGDEFVVVLPNCSAAHGLAVAEQLRAAVRAWEPVYGGRSFTLGVSIGLVPLTSQLRDVAAVLRAADMACYAAKRAGRNCVFTPAGLPEAGLVEPEILSNQ
ncbi:MAG: diguanylate cyclase [Burkholderiaceae bacterium]|jgi:diguanylate cyclase (GGDEF)-like protein/PAS domain S-box-containing protein|nr:diguanylate cyclase [Burkholderiaceae bacterium]MCO5103053.1 diguanylate cyclase [Burkholderiaceae bacterium]